MEGMDLGKLSEMLAQMQAAIDEMRAMMPEQETSAVEEEASVDEATEEKQPAAELGDDPEKALKKAAIKKALAME